jgi:hypothetical protein
MYLRRAVPAFKLPPLLPIHRNGFGREEVITGGALGPPLSALARLIVRFIINLDYFDIGRIRGWSRRGLGLGLGLGLLQTLIFKIRICSRTNV